jgi:hypothetical protein
MTLLDAMLKEAAPLGTPPVTRRGLADAWIALRDDGVPGTGTAEDALNGRVAHLAPVSATSIGRTPDSSLRQAVVTFPTAQGVKDCDTGKGGGSDTVSLSLYVDALCESPHRFLPVDGGATGTTGDISPEKDHMSRQYQELTPLGAFLSATVENNVVVFQGERGIGLRPWSESSNSTIQCFNNRTPEGRLVQGFDYSRNRFVDELTTEVEDDLILSLLT